MAFKLFQLQTFDSDDNALPPIDLNARCGKCEGTGIEADREHKTFTDCAACSATGSRLTYAGRDLMRFVTHHAGHIDIDAADEDIKE